jgi:mono/diheme cytochrome c family protein
MGMMVAVGVMIAACGGGGGRASSASTSSTSTALAGVQEGAQIFQARCASCHDARLAVRVRTDFPNVDDEIAVVTNGRVSSFETMPSFAGALTTTQLREVVQYTREQLGR